MKGRAHGQSILYVIVLMPTLLLILALSVQVAMVQLNLARLRSAVDLAGVGAASAVDASYYAETGRLRLDRPTAALVAREFLARNLKPIDPGGQVASSAEIAIINDVPARDPYSGVALDRPAVCIRARLPVPAGLLRLVGTPAWLTVTVAGDAELRS
ncbi:MAG TPA: hypothetical protein VET65_08885 [Candidatus Limnocylindrales bacterium]|nr:hypothetical protein [Candidatus Limnocylindrales bacterium]